MHLILTGATGLVGAGVLDAMIKSQGISKISILSRRPVKMAEDAKDPRINVIIHKDFETYDNNVLEQLKGATGVVWALGISQSQVGKEEYVKITKDYTLAAAEAFQHLPSDPALPFNFVFVSGQGSTFKPGRFTPIFGRVKGETELALSEMQAKNPLFHASTVRPSMVDAVAHDAIKPYIPQPSAALRAAAAVMGPPLRTFAKSYCSPTEPLGQFLTGMAMARWKLDDLSGTGVERLGDFPVIENLAIRRLMGLDPK